MIGPIKNVKQNRNLLAAFSWFQLHIRFLNKAAKLMHQSKDLIDKIVVFLLTWEFVTILWYTKCSSQKK